MIHQDTPSGIHVSLPPIQPHRAAVNAYRNQCSATALGMLIDGLIDELPAIAPPPVAQRLVEKLRFSLIISGYSNEWKRERIGYMIKAVEKMRPNFLSQATVESVPQTAGVDQAIIHPNSHYPNLEAL